MGGRIESRVAVEPGQVADGVNLVDPGPERIELLGGVHDVSIGPTGSWTSIGRGRWRHMAAATGSLRRAQRKKPLRGGMKPGAQYGA
ncbi:hypothetical protein GCM10009828_053440 [Actinoplanes couchii]|uniref:Uncharacterized protein n=1 Tax=Actinoplanes couchii TaxID=403638 RepID=A0ABQ3XRC2_9ACTN|nr:hypothetical protein Aco03nite_094270 [Actinoplanes couchii]